MKSQWRKPRWPGIRIAILLWPCILSTSLQAQIDTEFWFVAPNLTEGHGDAPVLFRFTAFEEDATLTIRQPANNDWQPITIQVPAGQSRSVDLTARLFMLENTPALNPLNKGIYIQSDQPITAYYEVNHMFNPDIFALKGRNALGKAFLIPAQNYYSNAGGLFPPARTAFDIVAIEDDTHIRITPTATVGGHAAGTTFEVVLQRGQTYSVEAPDVFRTVQLTGSRVTSDQLIAITLKHDSNLYAECYDLAGDQLVPIEVLGNEYIVVKGFLDGGDQVFVMATEDGTTISIDGATNASSVNQANLETGEVYHFNLQNSVAHIISSAPVYVAHITGFGCETGLAILPKLECTGSLSVSFNRSTEENFGLILITKAGYEDAFTVIPNRPVTPDLFQPVPGTDGRYVAARVNLTNPNGANQGFRISNSKGVFHLGTINGGDRSGTRYGYFSDFKSLKVLAEASKICLGSSMELNVTGSDTYTWIGSPDVEGKTTSRVSVQPDTTTRYGVIGEDLASGCVDTAYLEIEVFKWARPALDISPTCAGIDVSLVYTDTQPLESLTWIFEKDTFNTDGKDTFRIAWEDPGSRTLKLLATNPAGCISDTFFSLNVGGVLLALDSSYSVNLGEMVFSETEVTDGAIAGASITWSPTIGVSCTDCLNPVFSPAQTTDYLLTIVDSLGCESTYRTRVYVDPPVYIPNAFSPNFDGQNDLFEIYADKLQVDEFIVANRWGQIVHRSSVAKWDGRIDGKLGDPGVYVFYLKGVQSESGRDFETNGSITLIR